MNLIKIASQLLDNISEFAKNNKGLTAGILAGGGLGLLGGALTPTESEDPDEDAATRAKRRIGQAALLGSIGAAGAGALGYGLETVGNPIEEGGGLSFNKNLSFYTPAAAGVGAGIGGALLDNRAQEAEALSALKVLKLAENDYVASDDKLKAILPDVEKGKLPARDLLKGLSSAPNLRARMEELINKTGYKSLDELLGMSRKTLRQKSPNSYREKHSNKVCYQSCR